MQRRTLLAAAGGVALANACRGRLLPFRGPHRGITLDPWRARPSGDDFDVLRRMGVSHLALFPYAYMSEHTEPRVRRLTDGHPWMDWSLTNDAFLEMGRMARRAGLRTVLVPTLVDFVDGHWRGEVEMTDQASWEAWFDSYRAFVLHYAELGDQMGAVGFSVGTELRRTVTHGDQWLDTIEQVRDRFGGWLTYAANWDDYDRVPWWYAVDFIGVQAYFELGEPAAEPTETRGGLEASWYPIRDRLRAVSEKFDRKVLFTEVGYKSHTGSTIHPWKWEMEGGAAPELQGHAYEAAFRALWNQPWFAGFYWWKWHPARGLARRDRTRDFTPQGKPAEEVLRRWYRGDWVLGVQRGAGGGDRLPLANEPIE